MYILANGRLITRDGALPYLPDGGVAIDGGRIAAVGTTAKLREKYPDLIGMNVVMEEKTDPGKEKIERVEKIFGADKVNVTQGGKENG